MLTNQTAALPHILPRVLTVLGAGAGALFDGAVRASCSMLKWNFADAHGVPAALAPIMLSESVPQVLAHAIQVARSSELLAHAAMVQDALEHIAALPPSGDLWRAQRVALFHAFATNLAIDLASVAFSANGLRRLFAHDASVSQLASVLKVDELCAPLVALSRTALAAVFAGEDSDADAAVDAVLSAWLALFAAAARANAPAVLEHMKGIARGSIVLPYYNTRLTSDASDAAEHDSAAEDDAAAYAEQLDTFAALARLCALDEIVSETQTVLAALGPALADAPSDATWERLHWLCLVTGHVLADGATGETPAPPDAVVAASAATQEQAASVLHTLSAVLLGPLAACGSNSARPTSPQALESLLWLTARWVPTYLRESPSCAAEYHLSGARGEEMLTSLTSTLVVVATTWHGDADVLCAAAHMLDSLASSRGAMLGLLMFPQMHELAQLVTTSLERLPSRAQAPLLRALLRCTNAARVPGDVRDTYYLLLVTAVHNRMAAAIAARPDAPAVADTLYAVLSILGALAQSADPLVSPRIHEAVLEQLPAIVHLARVHSAHADVVLAALSATRVIVAAVAELDTPDEGAFAAARAHELVDIVPDDTGDAAELITAGLALVAAAAGAPAGGTDALFAFLALARRLSDDALSEPGVPAALAGAVAQLCMGHSALLASYSMPQLGSAPLAETAERGSPLEAVLCAALLVISGADARTADDARSVCDGLATFAAQIGAAPAAMADRLICALARLVLVGSLDAVLFAPVLHALRALLIGRARAEHLGGAASLGESLHACGDAALVQAAQHVCEALLVSSGGGSRAADAKAASAAVGALIPFVTSTRGALRVR